ncbi:MAG: hypothetical protein LUH51_08580 [Firmicutes bacterium]|nr:hypothetical protein [Bacillota bacterium]
MKKGFIITLAMVLAFGCFGCSVEEPEQSNNSLFTDSFCGDVVQIACLPCGVVSGEQVGPVLEYLQSLTLTKTDEHLHTTSEDGQQLYGLFFISFRKSNGYEASLMMNTLKLTSTSSMEDVEKFSYVAVEEFISGLQEAFEQGLALSEAEGDT